MESIRRARFILVSVFLLALIAIELLLFYPFENQLIFWSARGGVGFFGIFAAAVVTVLLTTYFPADREDPWKGGYYRYMRNFWGDDWGGGWHPYRISVCPAVRYTWFTLFFWFLFLGVLCISTYHALAIAYGGFEASFMWTGKQKDFFGNVIATMLLMGIMINIFMFIVFKVLFSKPINFPRGYDLMFGSFVSFFAILTLFAAPVQSFGLLAIGKVILWCIVVVGISWLVFRFFQIFIKMLFKWVKGLHKTALGQLISASSLHQTLCPEIVEKYIPPKEA